MVKKVTWFETSDGTQHRTEEAAKQHENKLQLFKILKPIAEAGLYCNVHVFFADNIDAICDVVDTYRAVVQEHKHDRN